MNPDAAHLRHIIEQKVKVDGTIREYECELVHLDTKLAIIAFRTGQGGMPAGLPVAIPGGSVSYGYFWPGRPYSIYRFKDPEDSLIAHRFDAVTAVHVSEGLIRYRDLVLDWWALPNDELIEEDREEFEELLARGAFPGSDIERAERAAREVTSRYRHIIEGVDQIERRIRAASDRQATL